MNSPNDYIVIQTALRPMTVYANDEVTIVADFQEFFDKMSSLNPTKDTQIFVDKGPGSYSGIRTGIAYVYGLVHAGLISLENVYSFTSFDLVHAIVEDKTSPIYLKAWPRLANGKIEGSKGYFSDGKVLEHGEFNKYENFENLVIYSEERLTDVTHENVVNAETLKSGEIYNKLIELLSSSNEHLLEPLYINPVHINA